MRLHLRLFHRHLDRDAARLLSAHHLQHVGGSAANSAHVPRLLHLQQPAVLVAVSSRRLDLCDPADRPHGAQVGPGKQTLNFLVFIFFILRLSL